jgi:hypothetical protein
LGFNRVINLLAVDKLSSSLSVLVQIVVEPSIAEIVIIDPRSPFTFLVATAKLCETVPLFLTVTSFLMLSPGERFDSENIDPDPGYVIVSGPGVRVAALTFDIAARAIKSDNDKTITFLNI